MSGGTLHVTGNVTTSGAVGVTGNSSLTTDVSMSTILSGTLTGSNGTTLSLGGSGVNSLGAIAVNGSNVFTIAGVIGGSQVISKTGTGTLILTGVNTYSAGVALTSGTLTIDNNSALGTGTLTMTGGTTLALGTGISASNVVSIAASGTGTVNVASGTGTLSGATALTTGVLSKSGSGILVLSGANGHSGGTNLTGGQITLGNNSGLGSGTLAMTGGTTLALGAGISASNVVSIAGGGTGTVSVATGTTGTLSGATALTSGILSKSGSGILVLSGANGHSGGTNLTVGQITLGNNSGLGSGTFAMQNGTILAMNSGIAAANLVSLTSANEIAVGSGTGTLSNIVSGAGVLQKTGSGTLRLTGSNTFELGTTLSSGTISIGNSNALGFGELTMVGGTTLSFDNGIVVTNTTQLGGVGTFTVNSGSATFSGVLASTGSITKNGAGTLVLSGPNTHSGNTNITAGKLTISSNANLGALSGEVLISDATLHNNAPITSARTYTLQNTSPIDTESSASISGIMGSTGALHKIGADTLELTGPNTYSGGTVVTAGTLLGNATSLQGNILNNATLTFNQPSSGTYSSSITGSGSLNKSGSGSLEFTGDSSSFTGSTGVQAGLFKLNGSLGGTTTLSSGATISGAGTFRNLINSGTVTPGNSIGTLYVSGDYTQGADGIYNVEIAPNGSSDKIAVSGTANLNGTVSLTANPGFYTAGTTFQILTAGGINGTFAHLIENEVFDYVLVYSGSDVKIYIDTSGALLPVSLSALPGIAQSVGRYMFVPGFVTSDTDLYNVETILLGLPPQQFINGLISISPAQMSGLPMLELENNSRLINSYRARIQRYKYDSCQKCGLDKNGKEEKCSKDIKGEVWIDPIGFGYMQQGMGQQYAFHANTYGFSIGGEGVIADQFVVGFGGSYSHSNLEWFKDQGRATSNTIYFGPFFGWQLKNFTLETAMLGSVNFYDVNRNIVFPGLFRTAKHSETAWNIVNSIDADYLYQEPKSKFFVDPFASFVFVQSFHPSFSEIGANSINLSVDSKYSAFFRSDIGATFGRDLCIGTNISVTPSVLFGWMQTVQLTGENYTANFKSVEMPAPNFTVDGYDTSPSQFHVGTGLGVKLKDMARISAQYSASFGDRNAVQEVKFQLEYAF